MTKFSLSLTKSFHQFAQAEFCRCSQLLLVFERIPAWRQHGDMDVLLPADLLERQLRIGYHSASTPAEKMVTPTHNATFSPLFNDDRAITLSIRGKVITFFVYNFEKGGIGELIRGIQCHRNFMTEIAGYYGS